MGCDIHAYLESKPKGNEKWLNSEKIHLARDYGAFTLLAGVRNYQDVPYPYEPKDLPKDLADFTASEYKIWDGDAHTESWLNLAELKEVFEQYDETFGKVYGMGDDYLSLIPKMEQLEADGYDCRLVFWFDN